MTSAEAQAFKRAASDHLHILSPRCSGAAVSSNATLRA
jgi:hypothetical protein